MAEVASGLIVNVLGKLGSVAYQEFGLVWSVKSDMEKLKRTMPIIKEVLLDAEKKQASNPLLKAWIVQLNEVLHDAEDVLGEIEYEALRKQAFATYGRTSRKVLHFCLSSVTCAFHFKLGHKIRDIRERLDEIAADKFGHSKISEDMDRSRDTNSISYCNSSRVIGRDMDQKKIISLLMHPNANRNVDVIPIVGPEGLGKTTLARYVYNEARVVGHFPLRMWVFVSNDFSFPRLIKEILSSACGTNDEERWNVDVLQNKLRDLLKKEKFLLVLDDVKNEDRKKWTDFSDFLIDGCKGSKIIVTTRSTKVASIMRTVVQYDLEVLSRKDCLCLFVQCAFKEGHEREHQNLFEIGKQIVEKCKGVPLTLCTLGSMLYSKFDESDWEFVRDNGIMIKHENCFLEEPSMKASENLQPSYDRKPIHLKQCFKCWRMLDDVGNLYINELSSRSFFQVVDKKKSFLIHDLIHDLAISIAQVDLENKDIVGTMRHLSFSQRYQEVPKFLKKLTKVRTVMFTVEQPMSLVEACILRFKYLRLLDLSNSSFEMLPSSIGTLKHLRYLDLSGNERIKELPNSICKLHNLQTLLLGGCRELERLAKDTRNMSNLRCLVVTIRYTCLLEKGSLDSLRCLGLVSCPKLEVLFQGMDGCLTNLKLLFICDCESLTSLPLNIKHLTALKTLYIARCPNLSLMGEEDNHDLQMSLQNLEIEDLPKLEVFPLWLKKSANTLRLLRIGDCENFKELPEWLSTLKSLHTLGIINCPNLSSLPEGTNHFTTLGKLKIKGCPILSGKCRREDYPKIANILEVELDEV